jgi:hypothetical protein
MVIPIYRNKKWLRGALSMNQGDPIKNYDRYEPMKKMGCGCLALWASSGAIFVLIIYISTYLTQGGAGFTEADYSTMVLAILFIGFIFYGSLKLLAKWRGRK